MKNWDLFFAACVFIAGMIWFVLVTRQEGPAQRPQPEYKVRTEGNLLALEQPGRRTIYVKPQSITAFVAWESDPEFDEVIYLQLGAKEYRIDVNSAAKLDEIEAFLVEHGAP